MPAPTQTEIDAALTTRRIRSTARAEQEAILQIGKRRPKADRANPAPRQASRWKAKPDFGSPTPLVARPTSSDGGSTFHFRYTHVSKTAVPTLGGRPIAGASRTGQGAAHASYVERAGAAEVGSEAALGTAHAAYIEREGAAEIAGVETLARDARDAPDAALLIFSNISDDPFLRQEYWLAVERCERDPRRHGLVFDHTVAPDWWAAVAARDDVPEHLANHIATHLAPSSTSPIPALPVTAEQAGEILTWGSSLPGRTRTEHPVRFVSGRGGRIQNRIVAELPHELDSVGRAAIVERFTARLQARGLMYTAVVHAPDVHNDRRNFHLHVIMHDRPARFDEARGQWDFEVAEYRKDGQRHHRRVFPFRQRKVAEVTQDRAKRGQISFPAILRNEFAADTNEVLARYGLAKRYDARSYAQMGIDRIATEHLGPKAAALESAGVPTAVGVLNAARIWLSAEARLDKAKDAAIAAAHAVVAAIETAPPAADNAARQRIAVELSGRTAAAIRAAERDHDIALIETLEAKARSRATKTRATCETHLADILDGRADTTTRKNAKAIARRFDEAQLHLDDLDHEFADTPRLLADLRADRDAALARVAASDRALATLNASATPQPRAKPGTFERMVEAQEQLRADAATAARWAEAAARWGIVRTPPQASSDVPAEAGRPASAALPTSAAAPPSTVRPLVTAGATTPVRVAPVLPTATAPAGPETSAVAATEVRHATTPSPSTPAAAPSVNGEPATTTAAATRAGPPPATTATATAIPPSPTSLMSNLAITTSAVPVASPQPMPATVRPPGASAVQQADAADRVRDEKRWDQIITSIIENRLVLIEHRSTAGKTTLEAPELSANDQRILALERFARRTTARLEPTLVTQRLELTRTIGWLESIKPDAERYPVVDGQIDTTRAPQAIKTLITRHRRNPAVLAAEAAFIEARASFPRATQTTSGVAAALKGTISAESPRRVRAPSAALSESVAREPGPTPARRRPRAPPAHLSETLDQILGRSAPAKRDGWSR